MKFINTDDYQISLDHDGVDHNDPVTCGNCDWSGSYNEADHVGDCSLTPGDPSPAGRCPKCDSLCYLHREQDRAKDHADAMVALLTKLVTGEDVKDYLREAEQLVAAVKQP